ncbi:MAG: glutaredoxin family protein [Methanomassiliicoccales archaeon]
MEKVMMYTLSTCPWCRKTKQWFNERNVPFDYVDYDLASSEEKQKIKDRLAKEKMDLSFPIVYIGDACVQGYNPGKYGSLLGLS